jgi:hypothetical protein
MIGIMKLIFN